MATSARLTEATSESPRSIAADWGGYLAHALVSGEKLFDFATVVAAIYAASALSRRLRPHVLAWQKPSALLLSAGGFALLFVFLLERHGGYRPCLSLLAIRETERVLRVTLQAFSLALVVAYLAHAGASRLGIVFGLVLVPLFLTLEKWQVHGLLCRLRSRGYATRQAVIVGTGSAARRIYTSLIGSPKFGIEPVAFVEEDASASTSEIYECSYRREHSAKVLPGPVRPELLSQLGASVLVIADPAMPRDEMLLTMSEAAEMGVTTYFAAEDFIAPGFWVDYAELDGIMLARFSRETTRTVYETGKRMLDVAVAAAVIVLSAPLAAIIAVLVKRTSSGPTLFRQQRVGKAGRLFTMYKFRTMYVEASAYGYSPGQDHDPRITPLGRLLRRTSLDELPQFLNVLLGQMSMVGPRPEMPFIVEQYTPAQRQRLAVKPGITGLWQISADRAFLIHENIEYDLYYVRHRSLFMDVAILLHTLWFAPRGV